MDSANWRTKKGPLEEAKEVGETSGNNTSYQSSRKDSRDNQTKSTGGTHWRQLREQDDRESTPRGAGWGAVPQYRGKQPPYPGGPNPTRERFSAPTPRPAVPVARDPLADQTIDEGRRIYVGNLPYDAKIEDIRNLFVDITHAIEDISMSVDPMTGRNPSYCFIDLITPAEAQKTIQQYNGLSFMGRPLKVKPGVKQGSGTGRYHIKDNSRHQPRRGEETSPSIESSDSSPYAFNRWRRMDSKIDIEQLNNSAIEEGRRLYVGGLPRFPNQAATNQQIIELFKGYNVQIVSKMISPRLSAKEDAGNHYYCYVDLASKEEADEAVAVLDGIEKWNWNIIVQNSSRRSGKINERQRVYLDGLPHVSSEEEKVRLVTEIKELLVPYGNPKVVSKIFTRPRLDNKTASQNRCYCFVEFENSTEADAAIRALSSSEKLGGTIRISASKHRGAMEDQFNGPW
jgi:RNA recognition motif-containing protein